MTRQCTSCGGFCGKVCQRENVAQPEQEPVAWLGFNERGECREVFTPKMKETFQNYPTKDMTPVYTTPYVATPRPQRKPLTDEQIQTAARNGQHHHSDFRYGVQFAEAAHGIKGEA